MNTNPDSLNKNNLEKAHSRYNELKGSGGIPTIEQKFKAHPTPLKAIRLMCIDCCGGNRKAPKECTSTTCPLYLFRTGKRPKF